MQVIKPVYCNHDYLQYSVFYSKEISCYNVTLTLDRKNLSSGFVATSKICSKL